MPGAGAPSCPAFLDAEGKRQWGRLCTSLRGMGMLTKADREMMAGLCQNWSIFVKCSTLQGKLVTGCDWIEARKLSTTASDAYRNYAKACVEFGLSPAARARVRVPEKKETSKGKRRFFEDAG